jgi:hypothetical protein
MADGGGALGWRRTFSRLLFVRVFQSHNHTQYGLMRLLAQGSKSSDKLLETFSEKIANTFVRGELCIADWTIEPGAQIKVNFPLCCIVELIEFKLLQLTLGPSSKKPLHIPLVEISPVEAASHATNVFLDVCCFGNFLGAQFILVRPKIALQAQSRKCRLHPPHYSSTSTLVASPPPRAASPAGTSQLLIDLLDSYPRLRRKVKASSPHARRCAFSFEFGQNHHRSWHQRI